MDKELKIRYSKPNAFEIYFEGGGELPVELQGRWTDRGKAEIAIEKYLLTRKRKAKKATDE